MNLVVHSLGCRVNQYESEMLAQRLTGLPGSRTVHLVNTCTVTSLADRKGRKLIRRLRREEPQSLLIAIGCQATVSPAPLAQAGADLVIPNKDKGRIPQLLATLVADGQASALHRPHWPSLDEERLCGQGTRVRVPLKVQDGCAGQCSYCLTRHARGPLRSKSPEAVVEEASDLVQAGHRELVLTGVNLGQYGHDLPEATELSDLLLHVTKRVPEARLRLSSLGPESLTDELVELVACTPRICPHLHLPLQSGDDHVLQRMRRPYTAGFYRARVTRFLNAAPGATFGTDVMVGFPGEDEQAFRRTIRLLQGLKPLNTHIFRFSPRPGTKAASLRPMVPQREAKARGRQLEALARRWSLACRSSFLNARVDVLVERLHCDTAWGHSENYLYVGFHTRQPRRGTISPVRVMYVGPECVMGVTEDQRNV